jgi:hypothetical protein
MGDKADERIAIDFIDPLFAVALAANFTSLSAEPWFNCPTMIFTRENLFHVASLFLAYLTVILSWIGYHKSIRKKGIDVNHWAGEVRFFLDVLILIFYFILLEGYNDFGRELWVLVAIYVLFIFWDQMKRLEGAQEGKDSGSAARRGVTVVWFIFFI